ncbi:porin [Aquiflexum gelatinilyticum]|uniref:porin n=1 Tax=Aquiflexum gelatinilyticum TaxID=2961943 RepID=UPI002169C4EC|nr:porin [Aquiflexum gelatinilyticum]MCS4436840.1 porin [Aquiflexum gelatinilyticum]
MKPAYCALVCFVFIQMSFEAVGQDSAQVAYNSALEDANKIDNRYKPLVWNLDSDGSRYFRLILWNQIWAKATETNPGTLGVDGNPKNKTVDIGIRRARILAYAQVSPKILFLAHFGINNQTFTNGGVPGGGNSGNAGNIPVTVDPVTGIGNNAGTSAKKPQMFLHDVWTEFKVSNGFFMGMGLHYWNGISRLSSQGTLNMLTLDAPIFNWPLIEMTDQFARQFGVYAKGQLGKWDYRVAVNKPFSVGEGGIFESSRNRPVAANIVNDNWATQGYIAYQFFEKENNKLPFFVGSYLGSKKVFNIGGGWHHHPKATSSQNQSGQIQKHDIALWSIDSFLDLPLRKSKGTAITVYAVYYTYDFGPNYLRNIGIMNVGQGSGSTQNGTGNAQPTIGTGNVFYLQTGFLLPGNMLGRNGKLQPFGTLTHKDFEYFDTGSWQYDLGMNYFLNGHQAKISLQYSNRPIFENYQKSSSAGEFILQTHIYL